MPLLPGAAARPEKVRRQHVLFWQPEVNEMCKMRARRAGLADRGLRWRDGSSRLGCTVAARRGLHRDQRNRLWHVCLVKIGLTFPERHCACQWWGAATVNA
jgi:hypothetical protein